MTEGCTGDRAAFRHLVRPVGRTLVQTPVQTLRVDPSASGERTHTTMPGFYLQMMHGENYEIDVPGHGTVRWTKSDPVPDVALSREFILQQKLLRETVPIRDRTGQPKASAMRFKVVPRPVRTQKIEPTQEELEALEGPEAELLAEAPAETQGAQGAESALGTSDADEMPSAPPAPTSAAPRSRKPRPSPEG